MGFCCKIALQITPAASYSFFRSKALTNHFAFAIIIGHLIRVWQKLSTIQYLGVAQFGRALGSGPRGRRFKSSHSDHKKQRVLATLCFLLFASGLSFGFAGHEHGTKGLQAKNGLGKRFSGSKRNKARSIGKWRKPLCDTTMRLPRAA